MNQARLRMRFKYESFNCLPQKRVFLLMFKTQMYCIVNSPPCALHGRDGSTFPPRAPS
jgi:hypothetical protein